jgi:hypothetical protein
MTDESSDHQIPAAEWRQLRLALADRLRSLIEARDGAATESERIQLQVRIDEVKNQVQSLAVEETVAQFVEDAERFIIAANTMSEDLRRDPDEEVA